MPTAGRGASNAHDRRRTRKLNAKRKPDALNEIARTAGTASCSFSTNSWHGALLRILEICEREGYDIIGSKIEK